MASVFKFDLAGESHRFVIGRSDFYLLSDGTPLRILWSMAWCENCQKFTAAEWFPSAADLQNQLSEAEYFDARPGLIPPDRRVSLAGLPERRLRLKWRQERTEPAKCLTCGSTAITAVEADRDVDIPGRGRCVGRWCGFADAISDSPTQFYTSEGHRISSPRGRPASLR